MTQDAATPAPAARAAVTVKIDGQRYEVPDPLDLTFAEASLVKRLSGAATPEAILYGMGEMDAEVFPAMLLIAVQRVNPKFSLEDVGKITWREMAESLERTPGDPPTSAAPAPPTPEPLPPAESAG